MSNRPFTRPEKLPAWTNFSPATLDPLTPAQFEAKVDGIHKSFPHLTREAVAQQLRDVQEDMIFINSRYQVNVRVTRNVTHLSIKRLDKQRVGPERYRDFMRIKDELVGPEREAVEIYPARNREVDTANQYHLWVSPVGVSIPIGWHEGRNVSGDSNGGAIQHPFDEEHHNA